MNKNRATSSPAKRNEEKGRAPRNEHPKAVEGESSGTVGLSEEVDMSRERNSGRSA